MTPEPDSHDGQTAGAILSRSFARSVMVYLPWEQHASLCGAVAIGNNTDSQSGFEGLANG